MSEDQQSGKLLKGSESQPGNAADAAVRAQSRRHTRRAFVGATAASVAAYAFYRHLSSGPEEEMQPALLRRGFNFNGAVTHALTGNHVLAPTYPLQQAETLRINGVYGLGKDLALESYRLQLVGMANQERHPAYVRDVTAWEYRYRDPVGHQDHGHDSKTNPALEGQRVPASAATLADGSAQDENQTGRRPRGFGEAGESDSTLPPGAPGLLLALSDITRLPRHKLVTQFKCIEGWSQIVHWAGVRMADFLDLYPPAEIDGHAPRYVYMETPDGDYYTGYELSQLRHPQALLVTEMMGMPLTQNHGAPLRLHMPTKYGYKQIKRIGLIAYTDDKPDDYWTKLGYDWHADL